MVVDKLAYRGGMPRPRKRRPHPALIPNYIAKRRSAKGMTQADLAAAADIGQGSLSEIESGVSWPRMEAIAKLSKALDCAPIALFIDPDTEDLNEVARDGTANDRAAIAAMAKAYMATRRTS